jgi:hypothetical protein
MRPLTGAELAQLEAANRRADAERYPQTGRRRR